MTTEFSDLSPEQINDVLAFRAKVKSDTEAERKQPTGLPIREEIGEFTLFSWKEQTTSIGVEMWLQEHSMEPVSEADLHTLHNEGFPKDENVLVALGDKGPTVYMLLRNKGSIVIKKTERVAGSMDDLWYPGWDWIAGTIFPARSKR